jgi:parallel beta-helix repeat protein
MAAGGCAEDRESAPHREHFNIVFTVPKRILLFVFISMGLCCLVCCLANTASMAQTTPEDICRHPPSGCDTGASAPSILPFLLPNASSPPPSSPAPAILPALGDESVTPDFAAFCQKLGYQVNPAFVSFISTPLTLPCMTPPPVQANPIALAPGQDPLLAGSGACPTPGSSGTVPTLTPIAEPPGAYVLPSNLCGAPDGSAGFQAALNAAAGGSLWIPAGCILNLGEASDMPSNITIACGQGATFHSTVPMEDFNAPALLVSHSSSNVTIEGCTFTANYTPSMAAEFWAMGGADANADPVVFNGGTNLTFTDNAVTNQFGNEGVLFDGSSHVTISNNYFAYNFGNGLQLSNCQNCNVTGNYSLDSDWDQEDAGLLPAGYDTGTWSNNIYACDSTGTGQITEMNGTASCYWDVGSGCSSAPIPCTPGQYSGVTVQNNTTCGPGADLNTYAPYGANVINNSFTNGGSLH